MTFELSSSDYDSQFEPERFFILNKEGPEVTKVENLADLTQKVVLVVLAKNKDYAFSYYACSPLLDSLRAKYDISVLVTHTDPKRAADSLIAISESAAKINKIQGMILMGHGTSNDIDLGEVLIAKDFKKTFVPFEEKDNPFFVAFYSCNTGKKLAQKISAQYSKNITFFAPINIVSDIFFHTLKEDEHAFYFGKTAESIKVTENVRKIVEESTAKYREGHRLRLPPPVGLSKIILDASNEDEILTELSKYRYQDFLQADALNLTPFHYAISKGYLKVMQMMLDGLSETDRRVILNKPGLKGYTPLIISLQTNNAKVIDFLLTQECVDLHAKDESTWQALHIGSDIGNLEVIKKLILAGANVYAQNHIGRTPFMLAVLKGDKDILHFYLNPPSDFELLFKMDLEGTTCNKETALHIASTTGNLKIIKKLILAGANIYAQDAWGRTPFTLAILKGHKHLVDYFLSPSYEHTTLFKIDLEFRNKLKHTALHIALIKGDLNMIIALVEKGADISVLSEFDLTLLRDKNKNYKEIADFLFTYASTSPPPSTFNIEEFYKVKTLNQKVLEGSLLETDFILTDKSKTFSTLSGDSKTSSKLSDNSETSSIFSGDSETLSILTSDSA